jgi:hypothetical protein
MPSEKARLPYETHERLKAGSMANRHLPLFAGEVAVMPLRKRRGRVLRMVIELAVISAALCVGLAFLAVWAAA